MDVGASSNGSGSPAWAGPWAHLRVDRLSPRYCRVTFDHAPANAVTATTLAEIAELIDLVEQDKDLNVVVFESAEPGFYLADYDSESEPAWRDLLVRLARAPAVTIASVPGGVGTAGKEFALACDLQVGSRAKAEEIATHLSGFDDEAIAQMKSARTFPEI
jgi:enoyl-CoA hydratase/carnithine racemase